MSSGSGVLESLRRNFLLALALGAGVYLVLAVLSGVDELRSALAALDWGLIPLILGLVTLSYLVRYARWRYYLRMLKVPAPDRRVDLAIFAAGLSMTISPGKLGEVLKSVFLRQTVGAPVARTAPAVFAERATDGTGMIAWGLMGALAFQFGPGLLLAFAGLTAAGVAVLRSRRLSLAAERLLRNLPLLRRLAPHVGEFHGSSNRLLAPAPLAVASFISFAGWGFEILAVYLCAVALGLQIPFLEMTFIFAVASIAGSLSMLPGGLGAAEAGIAGLLHTISGLAAGVAGALTLIIRLVTLWFAVLLGVLGLCALRIWVGQKNS
ncbi:flippase-like domain-containing protein [Rubrobacter taiwanensis]|uniref:Flippase-like domain-containing protein n=1 Tax=Rubrobacter taiwanensis TaxID=185139 RepID=A0A4R1BS38_9ACTN|nr:lysylphosphatidylglycerol synthase transmembrane domain-containing protein [Rubrobacter taiwanensis]TCJ20594.1 flippase-like domain-containing protein [Rubrobacter taiwanensis]